MESLIIQKAKDLFFNYGLKSVSMDDLAKVAGISKKTIYQEFSDKNQLVNYIVDDLLAQHHKAFNESRTLSKDAVEEVVKQSLHLFDTWASVNPGFYYELEKFFPAAWFKLEQHKNKVLLPGIIENLRRGKAEKNYREELDVAFTADLRIIQLNNALYQNVFSGRRMSTSVLIMNLTSFYLHGITTEKGKKLISKYIKEPE